MDSVFLFFALLWIGYALWCGLHAIADSIANKYASVNVRFERPIDVVHHADNKSREGD